VGSPDTSWPSADISSRPASPPSWACVSRKPHEACRGARVEPRVLEGERRLVGERLESACTSSDEKRAAELGADADGADHPSWVKQRHPDDRA